MDRNEVAQKLSEWFLKMGFPPERLPPTDKIKSMCTGSYYKVWESLMCSVESKESIKKKRLQVFCHELKKFSKVHNTVKETLNELPLSDEIKVWKESEILEAELRKKEEAVADSERELRSLHSTLRSKLTSRDGLARSWGERRLRSELLERVAAELGQETAQLREMGDIAGQLASLPRPRPTLPVKDTIDKCVALNGEVMSHWLRLERSKELRPKLQGAFNSTAICNASMPLEDDYEKELQVYENSRKEVQKTLLGLLSAFPGHEVWKYAMDMLVKETPDAGAVKIETPKARTEYPHTARACSLHVLVCLETIRIKNEIDKAEEAFMDVIEHVLPIFQDGDESLSEDCRELFVLGHERAELAAAKAALETECEHVVSATGVYSLLKNTHDVELEHVLCEIRKIDDEIATKKREIELLLASKERTGQKISAVYEYSKNLFSAFSEDMNKTSRARGDVEKSVVSSTYNEFLNHILLRDTKSEANDSLLDPLSERVSALLSFYGERARAGGSGSKSKLELSFELEESDDTDMTRSASESHSAPNYTDELKFYLEKFPLEKNRVISLNGGNSIWIFESIENTILRQTDGNFCSSFDVLLDFNRKRRSVDLLDLYTRYKEESGKSFEEHGWTELRKIDYSSIDSGAKAVDKIKKKLVESRSLLKNLPKFLDSIDGDLEFWRTFEPEKYIRSERRINGENLSFYLAICDEYLNEQRMLT